jgi:hypothetical protein
MGPKKMRRYSRKGDFLRPAIRVIAVVLMLATVGGCTSKRQKLLCDTDYEAVLRACREVLDNASACGLKVGGKYNIRWTPRSPEGAKFPKAILDVAPGQVQIRYEGCLILVMHGAFDHFGLIAYSKSFKEPYPGFKYGAREIVEGLWYFDDGYRDDSPRFRKKIDAWIEEGNKKTHQQGRIDIGGARPGRPPIWARDGWHRQFLASQE